MDKSALITSVAQQLQEVYNGKLWMGDTFKKKIDSISKEEAFTRPLPSLHSVAELVAHMTAWRKDVIRKIKFGMGELLDESEENWPSINNLKEKGWPKLQQEYHDSLFDLIEILNEMNDSFLEQKYQDQDFKGKFKYSFAVNGILHHDLYHLGQIGIVIKLIKEIR